MHACLTYGSAVCLRRFGRWATAETTSRTPQLRAICLLELELFGSISGLDLIFVGLRRFIRTQTFIEDQRDTLIFNPSKEEDD